MFDGVLKFTAITLCLLLLFIVSHFGLYPYMQSVYGISNTDTLTVRLNQCLVESGYSAD